MKKILFIDRDGTLLKEAPPDYQVDSWEKLAFYPDMFTWMRRIALELDFELVMVTNQDGLGTNSFPENTFWPIHEFVMQSLVNEDIHFSAVHIDKSFPADNLPTRKPGTGMLTSYLNNPGYDIPGSFVIGDRITDVQLAKNLGCKAIWLNNDPNLGAAEVNDDNNALQPFIELETSSWKAIYERLRLGRRVAEHRRDTQETKIYVRIDLDGSGRSDISTGLPFFDHMLDQLSRHSGMDLTIHTKGDLDIDEHHTIEDTAIALGETLAKALGDKKGIGRYGFTLPMDDCLAQVALDFSGRAWLVWEAEFKREKIGEMPTEMFYHFFKSFSDASRSNLNIKAEGTNEHHKIESIFKALARSVRQAIRRDVDYMQLPSTKGTL
ncbi:MAG: bifunctional imidazole glycerol-phosphate dehydratase/histidinol phosphatase [Sphingobacteriales bacterium SCN 48-20]|uniref:bifunctional histidinol-phosphatase/imidazoleglycerol-phosphate dehydratase HisB n=1 Tax=Terrimonas ferruginea TaxID=249 RepID=UPI00086E5D66|nr:bifunctional histidinol-phosphatase/imidazoleglycerol-phosphate dehydratase HisB [Terrimonas ferruginea]MBN8783822.1 bifunctional histidinol-phosphatase/imidazoleglycerol-phosphate dehydratase HisB [Terrimonas ferruginea]ODT93102.1 MAG: bifunctional imidazole glycerol-phosphate dehydratase/histidinol phosphatase [Sphingobacteriales bacterium SCN 48-20]OJW40863.1 MAG: bifunctional imidazole glycerol-phosphate dehydratase/histidinol phosphatase [Sphingobacteriales bacterium 48-107]